MIALGVLLIATPAGLPMIIGGGLAAAAGIGGIGYNAAIGHVVYQESKTNSTGNLLACFNCLTRPSNKMSVSPQPQHRNASERKNMGKQNPSSFNFSWLGFQEQSRQKSISVEKIIPPRRQSRNL
jgi:hypothetical protein